MSLETLVEYKRLFCCGLQMCKCILIPLSRVVIPCAVCSCIPQELLCFCKVRSVQLSVNICNCFLLLSSHTYRIFVYLLNFFVGGRDNPVDVMFTIWPWTLGVRTSVGLKDCFPHSSRPTLGPTQLSILWVLRLFPGEKAAETCR